MTDNNTGGIVAMKQDLEDILQKDVDVVTEAGISPYLKDDIIREAVRNTIIYHIERS